MQAVENVIKISSKLYLQNYIPFCCMFVTDKDKCIFRSCTIKSFNFLFFEFRVHVLLFIKT